MPLLYTREIGKIVFFFLIFDSIIDSFDLSRYTSTAHRAMCECFFYPSHIRRQFEIVSVSSIYITFFLYLCVRAKLVQMRCALSVELLAMVSLQITNVIHIWFVFLVSKFLFCCVIVSFFGIQFRCALAQQYFPHHNTAGTRTGTGLWLERSIGWFNTSIGETQKMFMNGLMSDLNWCGGGNSLWRT